MFFFCSTLKNIFTPHHLSSKTSNSFGLGAKWCWIGAGWVLDGCWIVMYGSGSDSYAPLDILDLDDLVRIIKARLLRILKFSASLAKTD